MTRGRAIGWTVAFFVSGFAASLAVRVLITALGLTLEPLAAGVIAQLVGFGVVTWIIAGIALKWGFADLRWRGTGRPVRGFGIGFVIGMVPALLALAVAVPAGGAGWMLDGGTFKEWVGAVTPLALLLLPAAFSEELIFRGVGYVALSRVFGRLGPALVLSLLFGVAHLGNPNVTALGVVNVALAGVFLSAAFWLPGGIWAATGVHLGWNLTLAALGAPVSGLAFTLPMLDYTTGGPGWLTGGTFGPEGGAITTLLVGSAAVLLFRYLQRDQRPVTNDQ